LDGNHSGENYPTPRTIDEDMGVYKSSGKREDSKRSAAVRHCHSTKGHKYWPLLNLPEIGNCALDYLVQINRDQGVYEPELIPPPKPML
jgi:hypothetical protein